MTFPTNTFEAPAVLLLVANNSTPRSSCLLARELLLENIIDFTQDDADTNKGETVVDDREENRDSSPARVVCFHLEPPAMYINVSSAQ